MTGIASRLSDERPRLKRLLTDSRIGGLVVEHRDRLTRFGYGSLATLLEHRGRRAEAVFPTGTGDDPGDASVAVIASLAARLSGRRHARRRAAQIRAGVKRSVEQTEEA